jgi:hypothetical protein
MSLTLSAESVAVEEGPCTSERRAVDDEFMAVHTYARRGEGGARGRGAVYVLHVVCVCGVCVCVACVCVYVCAVTAH